MSIEGHPVEVVELEIQPHPNADRLALANPVGQDWVCAVGLSQFKTGDLGVYVPIDSVVTEDFKKKYLAGSKIDIPNSRIRSVKIRGYLSQGLIIPVDPDWQLGQDVSGILGITKYEPPKPPWEIRSQTSRRGRKQARKLNKTRQVIHNSFPVYTKIKNHKCYPGVIEPGEPCVCLEKIHGSNHRAGRIILPNSAFSKWVRLKRWFTKVFTKKEPERAIFTVGSHNVIKWYQDDMYWGVAQKYGLDKLGPEWDGYIFYGEVYGWKVQELRYGCSVGERNLAIFDIAFGQNGNYTYLNWSEVEEICKVLGLPTVPVLYEGPWDPELVRLADGNSTVDEAENIREGFVVKPLQERWSPKCGRVIFKRISDTYLLSKGRTEYH